MSLFWSLVELVPPAWVIVVLVGALWAAAWAVVKPPAITAFPTQVLAGVVGAAGGQIAGDAAGLGDQLLGDVHVVGVSVGAFLVVVVVRRFLA